MTSEQNIFWEMHSELPREGPGDNASTLRALSLLKQLPPNPNILDVGCGPGMQTLALAMAATGSKLTALDRHQPFLNELEKQAEIAGVKERIKTVTASMRAMPFKEEAFDVIWSEAAIYIMGFQQGITQWKRFLKLGGYLVVSEPCWLKSDIPQPVRDFWNEYPAMMTIAEALGVIEAAGYKTIGHFILPESAWWDDYYSPLEERLSVLRRKYHENSAALNEIEQAFHEVGLYRKYSAYYGYAFYVMQKQN
jgi:SAM-dependent methyltransferase